MSNESIRDKIAHHALRLFDEKGYHGTTTRDICDAVGCKMPTVYYYFKNKEDLFYQIAVVRFVEVVTRLESELPKGMSLLDTYTQRLINKKALSEDEKRTYRLALKTWLGFEGCEASREKLFEWEQAAYQKAYEDCKKEIASFQWVKFFIRSWTSMVQRIMLLNEDISDEEIHAEIDMIITVATQNNKNNN